MKQEELDKYYMNVARLCSKNSYCVRAQVGAIIVKDCQIVSDGFNGTPKGRPNVGETVECMCKWTHGCQIDAEPIDRVKSVERCKCCTYAKLTTKPEVIHAESNAILKCARNGKSTDGATLYVTKAPCIECSKLIIQAGIVRVLYIEPYKIMDGVELLKESGIQVEQFNDPES